MRRTKSVVISAGFLPYAKYIDGTQIAFVAACNEFGTSTIPSRPFFRNAIAENKKLWKKNLINIYKKEGEKSFYLIGIKIVSDIRKSILQLEIPPNAPSTIRRKGHDSPLIDTGQMLRSVDHEVKKR